MTKEEYGDQDPSTKGADTVWVEGLLPGIDFCNHGTRAAATWEVDPTGSITGVPSSMYLILADHSTIEVDKEISISYGNKGNEELLYLYGFVIDNNPDDFLMVHYPMEAFQNVPFAESKAKLLELQNAEMRCLLPRSLLDHGFCTGSSFQDEDNKNKPDDQRCNYSWSGDRKVPSYLNRLVFPQDFLTTLRTIAMQECEVDRVSSLLEELVESGEMRQPSDKEVQAAVWEASGDYGALEMLIDLLRMKMMELEEGTGTEASDAKLLEKCHIGELEDHLSKTSLTSDEVLMTRNKWSSIVYRKGQKQLTSLFLKEAEHALELCTSETVNDNNKLHG